eukprot:20749-Eustigmatos_ZCMA.PRE.1
MVYTQLVQWHKEWHPMSPSYSRPLELLQVHLLQAVILSAVKLSHRDASILCMSGPHNANVPHCLGGDGTSTPVA